MRSRHLKLVITLFAVVAMIPVTASPASAQLREWRGEVIRVSDGDTFDGDVPDGGWPDGDLPPECEPDMADAGEVGDADPSCDDDDCPDAGL